MKLFIDDLLPEKIKDMKFLFLLESPYADEICSKLPLAGKSGIAVSDYLTSNLSQVNIPKGYPFGIYLHEKKDNRFGIINCSNKPMDKKVYDTNNNDEESEIIILNRIRNNPKTKSTNRYLEEDRVMHKKLLGILSQKLSEYHHQNNTFTIIACGRLAENFLTEIKVNPQHNQEIIPHPSRNQWTWSKNEKKLKSLISVMKKQL
jgi:hypothetical protein